MCDKAPEYGDGDKTDEAAPQRGEPMFNAPSSVIILLAAFVLIHLGRSFLSPSQDLIFTFMMAFVPARYDPAFPVEGWSCLFAWTSPVTYMFLHGDATHLAVNGFWLLAFGAAVAKRIGNLRFYLFSLICGLLAAAAHFFAHQGDLTPVIGASGAISGHMAAAIRFVFSSSPDRDGGLSHEGGRHVVLKSLPDALSDPRVLFVLAIFVLLNFGAGFDLLPQGAMGEGEGEIAWQAHLGGFVAGLLLFGWFDPGPDRRGPAKGAGDGANGEETASDAAAAPSTAASGSDAAEAGPQNKGSS